MKVSLYGFQLVTALLLLCISLAVFPQPITCLHIAKCYLHANKRQEAKKWLEYAIRFECSETEGAVHVDVSCILKIVKGYNFIVTKLNI